jgi:hypothetical protein
VRPCVAIRFYPSDLGAFRLTGNETADGGELQISALTIDPERIGEPFHGLGHVCAWISRSEAARIIFTDWLGDYFSSLRTYDSCDEDAAVDSRAGRLIAGTDLKVSDPKEVG